MVQSTGCGRHVFRLLRRAVSDRRPIPWLLLENVRNCYATCWAIQCGIAILLAIVRGMMCITGCMRTNAQARQRLLSIKISSQ